MHIRDYRPEDFDTLFRLDQECFVRGIAYSRFELMHYLRRSGSFTIVAEDERPEVVGFLVAECRKHMRRGGGGRDSHSVGHVITIDVSASARRSGIGTLLMDECEARLLSRGCDIVYLETAVDNAPAIKFYKRRGYSVLNTIPRYYDNRLDALVMGKRLPTAAIGAGESG